MDKKQRKGKGTQVLNYGNRNLKNLRRRCSDGLMKCTGKVCNWCRVVCLTGVVSRVHGFDGSKHVHVDVLCGGDGGVAASCAADPGCPLVAVAAAWSARMMGWSLRTPPWSWPIPSAPAASPSTRSRVPSYPKVTSTICLLDFWKCRIFGLNRLNKTIFCIWYSFWVNS